ncbi:MAG: hybrid sensor histidine kinase/response regulator [Lachnospiraceae bacterium]|nr:hybrid sensor histidine kinase/response regulator [Lachnospiraceae bacterium]
MDIKTLLINKLASEKYDNLWILNLSTKETQLISVSEKYKDSELFRKDSDLFKEISDYDKVIRCLLSKVLGKSKIESYQRLLSIDNIRSGLENNTQFSVNISQESEAGKAENKQVVFSYLDKENDLVYITIEDTSSLINERLVLEKKLEAALTEVNQSNNAKQELLKRMGHELRTPLNMLSGNIEMLTQIRRLKRSHSKLLSDTKSSISYLTAIVSDLIQYAELDEQEFTPNIISFSLTKFLNSTIDSFNSLSKEKNLTLSAGFTTVIYEQIYSDSERLKQVIHHIFNNSLIFSHPNSKIKFEINQKLIKDKDVTLNIIIHDNGLFLDEDSIDRIFTPYELAKDAADNLRVGSGLGMSIAKQIMQKLKGSLTIESHEGNGTTYTISLPVKGDPAASREIDKSFVMDNDIDVSEFSRRKQFAGLRCLIIDDFEANLMICSTIMQSLGFEVETATNGLMGLDKFAYSSNSYYSVIIMDIMMPIMDGIEAIKHIRNLDRPDANVPILAISADAMQENIKNCIDAGANAFLTKPINFKEVLTSLRQYVTI